jgi:hypothetical protein
VEETVKESARLADGAREPSAAKVAEWIGAQNAKRWADLKEFIDSSYPGVFNVEWLFGGKKYGWSLRFKKSKSFCTFIPERARFRVLLVFGGAEREKVAAMLSALVSHVREDYQQCTTYHDGKWLFTSVDSVKALNDVKRLLELKRRPKAAKTPELSPQRRAEGRRTSGGRRADAVR